MSGQTMVKDEILAFRKKDDEEVVYTIELVTPARRYEEDQKIVAAMQKTWRWQPLP